MPKAKIKLKLVIELDCATPWQADCRRDLLALEAMSALLHHKNQHKGNSGRWSLEQDGEKVETDDALLLKHANVLKMYG